MECYDITIVSEKSYSYYHKKRLDKCEQIQKLKLRKRQWTENELELFGKLLANPETNFVISFGQIKHTLSITKIHKNKYNKEIKIDNGNFKQNNADQVKGNVSKLEYRNSEKI